MILQKKVISIAMFVLITMAVVLGASATIMMANLTQSIAESKKEAVPADIAQMHAGKSTERHRSFTQEQQEHIAMQETMVLLNFEGMNLHYGENETMTGTIQDISFVVQNKKFDFLLNLIMRN